MSTLEQLKRGLSRAWENVAEGWRELVERAGDALTRFHPTRSGDPASAPAERVASGAARWGILAAEVSVDDDAVEVALEVPGMEPDDFEIQALGDALVVRGEKRFERERSEGRFHVMERAYGRFERAIALPVPVEENGAKARYKRGVLTVRLPRADTHKVRRIEVKRG